MKHAVLYEESEYIEGDERSRTNPGHGYPAHTRTYTRIVECESAEESIAYINTHWNSLKDKNPIYIEYRQFVPTQELKFSFQEV